MSDYISKLRDLLLQQSKTGRLSSLLDSIYGAASTGAEAYGAANSPMAPQHAAGLLGTIADLTPVVGDVKSAYEGVQAAREGDWAGAGLGLLGALPFVPGITAWHGSPHKFDKFSLDKIGTGEGAQAYGHGLYLAESPGVAKSYADNLSPPADVLFNGKPAYQLDWLKDNTPEELALRAVGTEKGFDEGRKVVEKLSRRDPDYAAALQWMDSNKNKIGLQTKSQLYKTDIPDEAVARFLDWDKPLSQQAPEVQAALSEIGLSTRGSKYNWKPELSMGDAYRQISGDMGDKFGIAQSRTVKSGNLDGAKPLTEMIVDPRLGYFDDPIKAKADFMRKMDADLLSASDEFAAKHFDQQAKNLGTFKIQKVNGQNAASDILRNQGIPGIRYLDGGSRATGKGSSNFVVFDDQLPRILERNGVPTGNNPWGKGEWKPK